MQALADYFTALVQMRADRPDPKHPAAATPTDEPLLLLLIANAYCQWATTRRVIDRHRAVAQSFAFLQQYHAARAESDPVEVYYNLGALRYRAAACRHRFFLIAGEIGASPRSDRLLFIIFAFFHSYSRRRPLPTHISNTILCVAFVSSQPSFRRQAVSPTS